MSAPKTDLDEQETKHSGPLTGMGLVVAFAAVIGIGLVVYLVSQSGEAVSPAEQVEGADTTAAEQPASD